MARASEDWLSLPVGGKMQDKAKTARGAHSPEDLLYVIVLWSAEDRDAVEHTLARAVSGELAQTIFKAAAAEHPGRRITLRKEKRVIAETLGE